MEVSGSVVFENYSDLVVAATTPLQQGYSLFWVQHGKPTNEIKSNIQPNSKQDLSHLIFFFWGGESIALMNKVATITPT